MSDDVPLLVLSVAPTVAAAIVALVGARRSSAAGSARLCRHVGLAMPPHLAAVVRARMHRSRVMTTLGLAVGQLVAAAIVAAGASTTDAVGATALGAATTGTATGAAVAAVRNAHRPHLDGVRIARVRRVTLDDYVTPAERLGGLVLGLGAGPVVLVVALAGPRRSDLGAMIVLAAAAAAGALLLEVGGRRIVALPQPAGSTVALAWDDALRAVDLRAIATAPICAGAWAIEYATAPVLGAATRRLDHVGTALAGGGVVLVLVGLLAVLVVAVIRKPQQHVLRRLWPEVAAAGAAR